MSKQYIILIKVKIQNKKANQSTTYSCTHPHFHSEHFYNVYKTLQQAKNARTHAHAPHCTSMEFIEMYTHKY